MPATTQQLPNPMGLTALRGAVVMPRHPEDFLTGPLEQCVVHSEGQRGAGGEQSGHDQIGQGQSQRVTRPAGVAEQPVCAAVMPHLFQPGAGEHSTHRSAASLRDQANNQPGESRECRSGKARPELGKDLGQRARYGGAGKHRRITLTRVMKEPSMLSSSPYKIHDHASPACRHHPRSPTCASKNCETRADLSGSRTWLQALSCGFRLSVRTR